MKMKLNATFFDRLNVVLTLILAVNHLKIASVFALITIIFFMVHIVFSKKTLVEIKNKMFE